MRLSTTLLDRMPVWNWASWRRILTLAKTEVSRSCCSSRDRVPHVFVLRAFSMSFSIVSFCNSSSSHRAERSSHSSACICNSRAASCFWEGSPSEEVAVVEEESPSLSPLAKPLTPSRTLPLALPPSGLRSPAPPFTPCFFWEVSPCSSPPRWVFFSSLEEEFCGGISASTIE